MNKTLTTESGTHVRKTRIHHRRPLPAGVRQRPPEDAVNIPHDRIEQAIDSIEGLEKNSSILLYCQSGARSAFACQVLAQRGYTRAMNGGAMATLLLNFERA